MKYLRAIAGIFAGIGSLMFIYVQEYGYAMGLLGTMLGFFVGEANGKRAAET